MLYSTKMPGVLLSRLIFHVVIVTSTCDRKSCLCLLPSKDLHILMKNSSVATGVFKFDTWTYLPKRMLINQWVWDMLKRMASRTSSKCSLFDLWFNAESQITHVGLVRRQFWVRIMPRGRLCLLILEGTKPFSGWSTSPQAITNVNFNRGRTMLLYSGGCESNLVTWRHSTEDARFENPERQGKVRKFKLTAPPPWTFVPFELLRFLTYSITWFCLLFKMVQVNSCFGRSRRVKTVKWFWLSVN